MTKPFATKQRRLAKRAENKRKADAAKREAAARQETKDEDAAPAAQRNDVLDRNGEVYKHARVKRSGSTFVVSNPIAHLVAVGVRRAERGGEPTIKPEHEKAAERLRQAWEEGGSGFGLGASDYGSRTGSMRGRVPTGFSDEVIERLDYQRRQAEICAGAREWLGDLWPAVKRTVIDGIASTAWAAETKRDRHAAVGYLSAAYTVLINFFAAYDERYKDAKDRRSGKIRSAQVVEREVHSEIVIGGESK